METFILTALYCRQRPFKGRAIIIFFEQITNFFETFRTSELDRETVLKYNRMRKKQSPFLASHQVIYLKVPNVFLINVDSELR